MTPEQQAMAIAEDVLQRLPAAILSGPSHEGDLKPADMTPMSIVVIQEAARYERLVYIIRTSSRAVIGAVQGKSPCFCLNNVNQYMHEYLFNEYRKLRPIRSFIHCITPVFRGAYFYNPSTPLLFHSLSSI